MMKQRKIYVVLLTTLVAILFILPAVISTQVWFHKRKELNRRIRPRETVRLVLTPEKFRSCKINEKEILYQGKMFDIHWIEHKEGEVLLYGHYDIKEDYLLGRLGHALDGSKGIRNFTFFPFVFVETLPEFNFFQFPEYSRFLNAEPDSGLPYVFDPVDTPPPDTPVA